MKLKYITEVLTVKPGIEYCFNILHISKDTYMKRKDDTGGLIITHFILFHLASN